jgi:glycosyltransferase involved in cell wall biosynthesis
MGCPVVSYDLKESRVSAGDAAVYATAGDVDELAACLDALLDDPERRARMGAIGLERVRARLSWQHAEPALLAAYEHAVRERAPAAGRVAAPAPIRP